MLVVRSEAMLVLFNVRGEEEEDQALITKSEDEVQMAAYR
jgi:hypothetical protein